MKKFRLILSLLLVCSLVLSMMPVIAVAAQSETANNRGVNNYIIIDDDATGGYEGDYVVIYNPATSSSTSYSTGTMTGLIETTVNPSYQPTRKTADDEMPLYKIDVDSQLAEIAETETAVERDGDVGGAGFKLRLGLNSCADRRDIADFHVFVSGLCRGHYGACDLDHAVVCVHESNMLEAFLTFIHDGKTYRIIDILGLLRRPCAHHEQDVAEGLSKDLNALVSVSDGRSCRIAIDHGILGCLNCRDNLGYLVL